MGAMKPGRAYEVPTRRLVYGRFWMLVLEGILFGVLYSADGVIALRVLCGLIGVVVLWWTFFRVQTRRVTESVEGLVTYYPVWPGKNILPWHSIDHFEIMRGTRGVMVAAVPKVGLPVPVVGLDGTSRIRWRDGDTDDIVGELNYRLRRWQESDPPASTS